jgi:ribose-phosphate pyrophosphokinase
VKDNLVLLTGNAHPELARSISKKIGVPLSKIQVFKFANDETFCKIEDNIRKREVFVVQPACRPVNDHLMELLIIIDACKRASAAGITAVVPYYGYSRTDKKDQPRVPITAKLVADLLTVAGAQRLITVDLHAEAIQGFFDIPVDALYVMPIFIKYIKKEIGLDNLVIVSPDAGGAARARAHAKKLGPNIDLAVVDKRRFGNTGSSEVFNVVGEVAGKKCVLVDDIIDTAGSITQAAAELKKRGAKEIWALAAHAVLSPPALERLEQSPISEVVVTDTVPISSGSKIKKLKVLSVAGLLAETIRRVYCGESVSSLFA